MSCVNVIVYVRVKISVMPKKSKVWLHFIKVDENKAKCNICAKHVATKDVNTTNLMKHLTMHNINLKPESCTVFDCKKKEQPASSRPPPSTSPPDSSSSSTTEDSAISVTVAGKILSKQKFA